MPRQFLAFVPAAPDAVRRKVSTPPHLLSPVSYLVAEWVDGGIPISVAAISKSDWPIPPRKGHIAEYDLRVPAARGRPGPGDLRIPGHSISSLRALPDDSLPDNVVVVADGLFRQLAFRTSAARDLPPSVARTVEVAFADGLAYTSAVKLLETTRVTLKTLTPLRSHQLVCYRVRDNKAKGGAITREVVDLLRALPPTFAGATAYDRLPVPTEGGDLVCLGTTPQDPGRFASALTAGGWIAREDGLQAVVPADWARRRGWTVGESIHLKVPRSEFKREETITVRLKLVGLTAGAVAYVPHHLLRDVRGWKSRRLDFDEVRNQFRPPLESALEAGHPRCNFFARDAAAVEGLVKQLRGLGYETEDHLAEQADLRRLGRVMVAIVIFFSSGCVIIAAITVGLTTMLSIQAKSWEIGILRSMGVASRDVLGIFLLQGLLIGLTAFGLAMMVYIGCEQRFRQVVAQGLGIKEPAFVEGWALHPRLLWLPAVVCLVSLGFTLLGVWLPARRACQMMPAEALRSRE